MVALFTRVRIKADWLFSKMAEKDLVCFVVCLGISECFSLPLLRTNFTSLRHFIVLSSKKFNM